MNEFYNNKLFFRLAVVFAFAVFVYYISDVLIPIVISFLLFYILNPLVSWFSEKHPKGLGAGKQISIFTAFAMTIFVLYLFFKFIVPPLAMEFQNFGKSIPRYLNGIKNIINFLHQWYAGYTFPNEIQKIITQSIDGLLQAILSFAEQIIASLIRVSSRFIQLIIIPILTYYLLKDKDFIKNGFINLMPTKDHVRIKRVLGKINDVVNNYVKGVGMLCVFIGATSILGLYLLGVRYFLILGLIAGITEAIPFLGPWIGAVPAIIIAFLSSPVLALKVAFLYLAIQIFENTILVPKVLGVKLDLHPVAIIIAMLILGKLIGAWGLFFAAPILAILRIIYFEIQEG